MANGDNGVTSANVCACGHSAMQHGDYGYDYCDICDADESAEVCYSFRPQPPTPAEPERVRCECCRRLDSTPAHSWYCHCPTAQPQRDEAGEGRASFRIFWSAEDDGYIAIVEGTYISAFGDTPKDAFAELQTAIEAATDTEEK